MDAACASAWRPTASLEMVRARARLLKHTRDFLNAAGILEVETPVLSHFAATDPALESFVTDYTGPGEPRGGRLYLNTSPEFSMKRLLAAGSGPIFQVSKAFRDGEAGALHNPEFTLLEWYRPGFDHHRLMEEVAGLVRAVWPPATVEPEVEKISYGDAFARHVGLDPHLATPAALTRAAARLGIPGVERLKLADRDEWLDLLMSHCVQPKLGLGGMTFVYDYPASQAALARIRQGEPPVAERFELYIRGVELANGFHELLCADEQRRRFEGERKRRRLRGQTAGPPDKWLLAALENGLPDCSGVALGLDRLLMVVSGARSLDEVISFPLARA